MTAFELCGQYDDEQFRLKRGRVTWESISYMPNCDKCLISRVVESGARLGLWDSDRFKDILTPISK